TCQPRRFNHCFIPQRDRLAGKESGHNRLGGLGIAEAPPLRGLVEHDTIMKIARCCDRRHAADRDSNSPGKVVGAMVPTQKGKGGPPILGNGVYRRSLAFVREQRPQRADQYAGRTTADDGPPRREQGSQVLGSAREGNRTLIYAEGKAVNLATDGIRDTL